MLWLLLGVALFTLYLFYLLIRPVFYIKEVHQSIDNVDPPSLFTYAFQVHVHTQFSYDSLGKPEDIKMAARDLDIDFVIITDHENDHIKHFCDERMIAGVESKITDERGNILGDVLTVGDLRMVAHPFKRKYAWKLEKSKDLLVEVVDLKDDLLLKKSKILLYLPLVVLIYPFSSRMALNLLKKVLDLRLYAKRYAQAGWNNKVFGGLDHHVKIYIREVGVRFLFPSYRQSFSVMRNFLLSKKPIKDKEEFIKALKEEQTVVSFDTKPSLVYKDDKNLVVITPYRNSLVILRDQNQERVYDGSMIKIKTDDSKHLIVYAYLYTFKLGRLYFGLKPLFITTVEV